MAGSAFDWFLKNVWKADWWRAKACNDCRPCGCSSPCCDEGGVDVPVGAGQPLYALATGTLTGSGDFCHDPPTCNHPGYGVITEDVPGVGQVYYQHIARNPAIPQCKNGNCGGYVVQAGQLVGWGHPNVCGPGCTIVEVGINPTWGGIWGTNRNNALWVADPRQMLANLAKGGGNVLPQINNAGCSGAKAGSCKQCRGGVLLACPTDEQCSLFNSDGSVVAAPLSAIPNGVCVSNAYVQTHGVGVTTLTNPTSGALAGLLPDWLQHPDWKRVLKFIGGILCLGIGLLVAFWPQATEVAKTAVEAGVLA